MNDLQVLQNKDLKIILNGPLYSSATAMPACNFKVAQPS